MSDMRTVFAATASALLDEDPLAAVVLAEISVDMFGKAAARHPDRVLNVGIREQLMVSVGGGLALAGMRPIVHSYAPFLVERAYEQVKLDLAHQGVHAVLVSIGASYDGARSGRTHQAPEDVVSAGQRARVLGGRAGASGRGGGAAARGCECAGRWLYISAAVDRDQPGGAAGVGVAAGGPFGAAGGRGGGGAYAVAGAGSRRRPGRDRGVRDHGAAVRRFWAACGWRRGRGPWCWSSRTWPGRLLMPWPPRWPRGRTGC